MISSIRHYLSRALIGLLVCFVPLSIFGAESATKEVAAASAAPSSKITETRDAFLAFALEKAKTYTDKAEVAVSKAVDVVGEEAPVAMKEFLIWRAWMHGIKAISPVVVLTFGLFLFFGNILKWTTTEIRPGSYHSETILVKGTEKEVILTVLGGVLSLSGLVSFCVLSISNIMSFIQVIVAPRIYIIEQVMGMFK